MDLLVGVFEKAVELFGLFRKRGQGAPLQRTFAARVLAGGNGFGDRLRHGCGMEIGLGRKVAGFKVSTLLQFSFKVSLC